MTKYERLKNLANQIYQLLKNKRIVRSIIALAQKIRGKKPGDHQHPGSGDPIIVRESGSGNLNALQDQIPKDAKVDNFDTDRNIFDPLPDLEIDFSKENNLEAYTKSLNVPREVIENWVAAGILRPDEILVAEKMLKIMRKKDARRKKKQDPGSTS